MFAYDALTGTNIWSTHVASGLLSPTVSSDGKVVYVGCSANNLLYALDATTGSVLWNVAAAGMSTPALSTDGKTAYSGSWDWTLNAVNTTNQSVVWTSRRMGGNNYQTPTLSSDGTIVFVGNLDKHLYAYSTSDGNLLWDFSTGNDVASSPAVSSDGKVVYVGSLDKSLYAVDATTGTLFWSFNTSGVIGHSSPAVSRDGKSVVYVGSWDSKVYALQYACDGGYTGSDCKRVDYCYEKPCVHGMCTNGNSSYACRCSPGWLGYDCSDVDYCYKETCSDRGTCRIIDASSTAGHHSFKTVRVLVAASENSTTAITTKSPAFRIKATGAATAAGSDRSNPKSVLGTSNSLRIKARATRGSGYQCDCNPGFTGRNCENTYCTGETCSGHGKCVNEDDGHYCDCTPGFVGDECADTYCSGETCSGHGSCTNGDKGYTCHCTREYFGKQCGMKVLYGALFGVVSVVLVVLIVVWWLRRRNVKYEKVKESNARLQNVQNTIYEEMSEPTHGNDNRNRTRSNRRFEANLYEQVQAEPFQPPPPSAPPAVLPARYAGDARGAPRAWQCPVCNTTIPGGHNFCRTCGTAMHQSING